MINRAQKIIVAWLKLQEKEAVASQENDKILWLRDKIWRVENKKVEPDPVSKRERQLMDKISELEAKLRGIESAKKAAGKSPMDVNDLFGGIFQP